MKKARLVTIFYGLFIFVLAIRLLQNIMNGYEKESWHITEYLINYQGGFVRRGLLGEALFHVSQFTSSSPYYIIITLSLSAYIGLVYFITRAFIKKGYPIFILPFVFFLGNPIINDFWVRKDIIELLLFILIIHLATKTGKRFIVLINTVLIAGILIHESIAFFCLPILALIFFYKNRKAENAQYFYTSVLFTFLQLLPALTAFLSVVYFKGSVSAADIIWQSWRDVKFPIENEAYTTPQASIDGISWTLSKGLSYFYITIKNFDFDIYAPFAWVLIITSIYFVLININNLNFGIFRHKTGGNINRAYLSALLLIQLIAVVPLFILGWDYGRWVFLWTTSSFIVLLVLPQETLSDMLPQYIISVTDNINRQFDNYLSNSRAFQSLLCLIIGVPFYNWSIINYVDTLAPILVLQFISDTFYEGVVLIKSIFS
ncbi:hypothetical protein Q4E40_03500 [Pontibacter sp. BT731]|uniref:hypothetical protein n=1 Tax=Pontibacter coccineus TaxID=3063328 RepID=UPI0026E29766|nr:hypothetical protein [Pontibacter sp. BT731]MDO6389179.1 hypothetical protein [Pontibacter sp. BT731]